MRFLLAFVFSVFSLSAFSADYSWLLTSYSTTTSGGSPESVCRAHLLKLSPSGSWAYHSVLKLEETKYSCRSISNGTIENRGTINRSGDSCSSGYIYNAATGNCDLAPASDGTWCSAPGNTTKTFIMSGGVCVAPTDATLANQCKAYSKSPDSGAAVVNTWKYPTNSSEDLRNPQKIANHQGCEIQLLEDVSCKTFPAQVDCSFINADGSCHTAEKTMKCRTKSVLTGNVAPDPLGTPAGSLCTGDECEITPPADLKESKPCTYVYDAEGRKSCTSWAFTGKEGAEQCGTVNGTFSCKNDLPKAVGKGLSIATEIEEETLGDGTKKTTKTDTAKQVNCSGQNACTTTTTTNKTVSIHGADGSLQSTTGTCTGALCAGGTSPDGDGDGLGDCTGTDCGDEEGAPIAGPATPELEEQDT